MNIKRTFEEFINEKREDVGKYNTVKKVIAKLGRRPSEQELATFINNNYYDVTEVERGEDDPSANDKIADLVAFYKFDIEDWEIAWADAQNESVVTEAKMDKEFAAVAATVKKHDLLNKIANELFPEIAKEQEGGKLIDFYPLSQKQKDQVYVEFTKLVTGELGESVVTEATNFKVGDKVEITKSIQDAEHDETGHLYDFNPGDKVEITNADKHSYQFKYLDKSPDERYWAFRKEFKANVIKESVVTEGKTSAVYTDPKTGKGYDLQYVSSKKRWELDIMKKGASIYSNAITTIKRDTLAEIQEWLDGYKIDSSWTKGLSESVVNEAKNTIGLAFKDEDDYTGFVEFIKDEKGSIKKDFGWDSKTKSWEVIMDVKVLDNIYGEGTPGNKESGWYGALPGDFESVIIESILTESKSINRDVMIEWLQETMKFVSTTEEFDGSPGGIWVSGEDGETLKGKRIYDYYNEGSTYEFGVLKTWEKELNKRGWYSEWYDAGTVMIWQD